MRRARAPVRGTTLIALAALLGGCSACENCGAEVPAAALAELVSATAPAERDLAASQGQWTAARPGDRFALGDGLRTGEGGAARVSLSQGGALRLGERSFVRFLASAPETQEPRLQVDLGDLEVRSGEVGVELQTGAGRVRLERMSALEVDYRQDDASFEVTVGQASFLTGEDERQELPRGERVVVDLRTGRLEPRATPPTGPAASEQPDAAPAPLPEDEGGPFKVLVRGSSAQLRGPDERSWSSLPAGERDLAGGTTLRLGAGATAEIRRGGAQASLASSSQATLGGGATLTLASGQATVTSTSGVVTLAVPGGTIVLRPNSRSAVNVGSRGTTDVRALRGRVEVRGDRTVLLGPGAVATLSRAGEPTVEGRPTRSELLVSAGSSAVIHDPRPPTSVGLRVGETCPGAALVEVPGSGELEPIVGEDEGTVILRLPTGTHEYRVYCVTDDRTGAVTAATGRVRVIHDPGSSPMGVPSHNTVDADGRSYTVLYQTSPPRITFRWPDAPARGPYELHVQGSTGRAVSRQSSRPQQTFSSGTFGGGSYGYYFTSADGRRSPQSRMTIRTDSNVSLASIREPVDGAATPGSRVRVSGTAREGASVSVGGVTIPFESPTRFGGEVTAPSDLDALAIRVAHPSAGVHFFLRRLARSGQ